MNHVPTPNTLAALCALSALNARRSAPRLSNPEAWHRTLCPVTDQLLLCGDLAEDRTAARTQLAGWVDAGVTHIVDARLDVELGDDLDFVATHAPGITYLRASVDDDGDRRDDAWFDAGTAAVRTALADPSCKVVVHCHMGINRGPSLAFAALLAEGWGPIEALTAIRRSRPIAAVLYAPDAVDWHFRRHGASGTVVAMARRAVRRWQADNAIDTGWVISRIRDCA